MENREQILQDSYTARDTACAQFGEADPNVLSHIINPSFMGGPSWPDLRQAWRTYRKDGRTIVVSDGLCDPFPKDEDEDGYEEQGLGIEVYAETSDPIEGEIQASWLFSLVHNASQQAASTGAFYNMLKQRDAFSMELYLSEEQGFKLNKEGRVGVLIGVKNPNIDEFFEMPKGKARLVSIKLLSHDELKIAIEEGDHGREKLLSKFKENGTYHLSSLNNT